MTLLQTLVASQLWSGYSQSESFLLIISDQQSAFPQMRIFAVGSGGDGSANKIKTKGIRSIFNCCCCRLLFMFVV